MSRLFNNFYLFFSPIDTGGSGGELPSGEMGKEDVIKFLGEDDNDESELIPLEETDDKGKNKEVDEEPSGEKKKVKSKPAETDEDDDDGSEEDDEDELAEIERELEGPTEEQLELVTPVRRKEILKEFPDLFKKFPQLEKSYYRDQQFTEIFPTLDDARETVGKAETLDRFERDLMGGNTETILTTIKSKSPETFHKVVDNYLSTLSKVDNQAYHHVLGNIIKHTIDQMGNEARRTKNENLYNTALMLNQFVFGTTEFVPPTTLSKANPESNKAEEALQKKEQAYNKQVYERTRDDLNTRVGNSLKATIDANIDPKTSMTDYVKKNASRDCLETLTTLIDRDKQFKSLVDKLWERAHQNNYDKASTDRIRSAYVSKAKTLLPAVLKKARIEALKGSARRAKEDDKEELRPRKGQQQQQEKPSSQRDGRGKIKSAKDIPAGMRSIDFLMQD